MIGLFVVCYLGRPPTPLHVSSHRHGIYHSRLLSFSYTHLPRPQSTIPPLPLSSPAPPYHPRLEVCSRHGLSMWEALRNERREGVISLWFHLYAIRRGNGYDRGRTAAFSIPESIHILPHVLRMRYQPSHAVSASTHAPSHRPFHAPSPSTTSP